MKYLKLFESHTSVAEVAEICNEFGIDKWTLNSNGLVDVNYFVNLASSSLTSLPLKFGRVESGFWCNDNNLTSLIGCPKYVGRDFNCRNNNIKSFEGIGYIGGYFFCLGNPIYRLYRLFQDVSKIDQFNEWSIIQGDNVILYRLNDFLEIIGKPEVTEGQLISIKKYYNVI